MENQLQTKEQTKSKLSIGKVLLIYNIIFILTLLVYIFIFSTIPSKEAEACLVKCASQNGKFCSLECGQDPRKIALNILEFFCAGLFIDGLIPVLFSINLFIKKNNRIARRYLLSGIIILAIVLLLYFIITFTLASLCCGA
jgi:cellulose synthase/poly-beta-1,6-N-acetylglucosamine synthase-like glycosyltransferase